MAIMAAAYNKSSQQCDVKATESCQDQENNKAFKPWQHHHKLQGILAGVTIGPRLGCLVADVGLEPALVPWCKSRHQS